MNYFLDKLIFQGYTITEVAELKEIFRQA